MEETMKTTMEQVTGTLNNIKPEMPNVPFTETKSSVPPMDLKPMAEVPLFSTKKMVAYLGGMTVLGGIATGLTMAGINLIKQKHQEAKLRKAAFQNQQVKYKHRWDNQMDDRESEYEDTEYEECDHDCEHCDYENCEYREEDYKREK